MKNFGLVLGFFFIYVFNLYELCYEMLIIDEKIDTPMQIDHYKFEIMSLCELEPLKLRFYDFPS